MQIDPATPPPAFEVPLATTYDNHASERDGRGEASWRNQTRADFPTTMPAECRTRLLEIGAGTGHTALWYADNGIDVIATDLSPGRVVACRAKGLEAHVRNVRELGFAPATFDAAWAASCLLHVPNADPATPLGGVATVLSKRGLFSA